MKRYLFTLLTLCALAVDVAAKDGLDVLRSQLILGGELSNSAATCVDDVREVLPRMRRLGLNTVLVPVYWELLEPKEGTFDFTLVDEVMNTARQERLQIVILWFGAWKNSMSCYAPEWFKRDTKRFPRAVTASGKQLEIASAFAPEVMAADRKAFGELMDHVAQQDPNGEVVIMTQVENEIGMLESARDYSPLATKAYNAVVPRQLTDYLQKHRKTLHPKLAERYNPDGRTWAEMFGTDAYGDEIFMAWHHAVYVEQLSKRARESTQMPLYVNAALNSRGRKPGEYPSAGPLAHLIDVWRAGAPTIAMLSPDIYDTGFKSWAQQYAVQGNPLFIPETRCSDAAGVRALYAFGEHGALGYSPFAIDQTGGSAVNNVTQAYALLRQLEPLLLRYRGTEACRGLLFDQEDTETVMQFGNTVLTCSHYFTLPWDPRATDGSVWPEGGGIVLRLADDEYLIAGNGIVVQFMTLSEKQQDVARQLGEDGFVAAGGQRAVRQQPMFTGKRMGLASVDQVSVLPDGSMNYIRRDNGDQSHQGRHARIGVGEWKILHVKLYEY